MKLVLGLLVAASLVGCGRSTNDITHDFALSGELEGCRVFILRQENGPTMRVVKCPFPVTTRVEKQPDVSVVAKPKETVVDGVRYREITNGDLR